MCSIVDIKALEPWRTVSYALDAFSPVSVSVLTLLALDARGRRDRTTYHLKIPHISIDTTFYL